MKKVLLFSLIAAVLFLWIRSYFMTENDETANSPEISISSDTTPQLGKSITAPQIESAPRPRIVPASKNPIPVDQKTSAAKPQTGATSKSPVQQRPPGTLRYELDGGWIVVYGDVLLGQPATPKAPPATGFVNTPPLRTWETREIPFFISEDLPAPQRVIDVIEYFNSNTPIRFVPYEDDKDAIVFVPAEKHCRSYLGRIGGHQPVFLAGGCGHREIIHEVMHALGFVHEHTRPDRDRYVRVHWDRITDQGMGQFEVVPDEWADLVEGRPFDYQSVMIYGPTLFARTPGSTTLESVTSEKIAPTSTGLSREDIERLYRVYGHLDP